MVNFGEKAKIEKAGNLNQGRSYVITTVKRLLYELNDSVKAIIYQIPFLCT